MMLKPEEISSVIKKELEKYKTKLNMDSVGTVLQVGDAIAKVYGLDDAMMGEVVEFSNDIFGMVFNLEEDSVGVIIFGIENPDHDIKEGDTVKRTGKVLEIPVGEALIGRVVGAMGNPIDGKGPIITEKFRKLEENSPSIVERQPVSESLETGIKAIDAVVPIGLGQRELIIGDRQTGKTSIAIDIILNQKGKDVYCIYVAIGQKLLSIVNVNETLKKYGAMDYTTIISASSRTTASLQYIAPFAGCCIAEELMYQGKKVLLIFDDLTKHAQAYRQLSLLMRRSPGREAYPGDVFYLHSRLLERGAKLNKELGSGSITILPIIETQAGDITSYIPTNVISITDGQVYLESDLFYSGIRPAINVGLSVSRVGGKAQTKAMRQVAGKLRLDIAQYRELESFVQFGADLDKLSKEQILRGEIMVEILKQKQYEPLPLSKQILIIYAGITGILDDIQKQLIKTFEKELFIYSDRNLTEIETEINEKKEISDELKTKMSEALKIFKEGFLKKYGNTNSKTNKSQNK
jgi:F-type H+/Na+-transporting ATPase subunit alpha